VHTLNIIKKHLHTMTKSERLVASFYLGNATAFAFSTLDSIAEQIGTSTTSVLRFCRRIGFDGYKSFQTAVQGEINYQPDLPDKFQRTLHASENDALLTRTIQQDILCIKDTFQNISNQKIREATQTLVKASRIFTFGMKESYTLAYYAYTRFLTVRPDVHILSACQTGEIESVLSVKPDDVCILFLFHRYTRLALQILDILKTRNCNLILITDPPYEELASPGTLILPCQVDAGGIKNTAVAPVVLTDYLCNSLAVQMGDAALQYMKQTEELFRASDILKTDQTVQL